jgi:hypothetical protein
MEKFSLFLGRYRSARGASLLERKRALSLAMRARAA